MPSRAIEAGRAFMRLTVEDNEFKKRLAGAQQRLRSFGAGVQQIGASFAGFGAALGAPLVAAIKAASDAQETFSKFDVVFGENAAAARKWGDELASQVGRSRVEVNGFLAGFQDLLVPIGIDPDVAQESSKQLTQLAIDLASFNNLSDGDAVRDLQAALTGSSEVMKKYGVIVNQTAVNQELLNQGIDPRLASEQEKVFARLNIILAGTTAAQGDAVRTADGFANRMRALGARVQDTAVAVGQALLPAVTAIVDRTVSAVEAFQRWANANQDTIRVVGSLAAALVGVGAPLVALGATLSGVGIAIGGVTAAAGGLSAALTFLAAHPIVAALMIPLGLALGGVVRDMLAAEAAAAKLDSTLSKLESRQTFGDASELATFAKRFEQLAGKSKLTADELAEARDALKALRSEYGISAGEIDEANGRILDSERALAQLRTAQSQQSKRQLSARIFAQRRIIQELEKQKAAEEAVGGQGRGARERRLSEIGGEIAKAEGELRKLQEQRQRVLRLVNDTEAPGAVDLDSAAQEAGESAGKSYAEAFASPANSTISDALDFGSRKLLEAQESLGDFTAKRIDAAKELIESQIGGIRSLQATEFRFREGAFGGRNLAAQSAVTSIESEQLKKLTRMLEVLERLENNAEPMVFT